MDTRTALAALEKELRQRDPAMEIKADAPMSAYTTLGVGGPADLLALPRDRDQLRRLLLLARQYGVPTQWMGRGSNLLVRDGGLRGLTIRLGREMGGITAEGVTLRAQAGASLARLAQAAAEGGLAGLAFASGIPGTVGGGVYMNAGAYGGEMCQTVAWVEGLTQGGEDFRFSASEMGFGYRRSRLQAENLIVTDVTFSLTPGDREGILAEMGELNRRRAQKQPLELPSAGSFFKRPPGGYVGPLIEGAGLKGYAVGGAQVSAKHAGFLVNAGGATAADFLALIAHVQRTVLARSGIRLEPEVRIVGEDRGPQRI